MSQRNIFAGSPDRQPIRSLGQGLPPTIMRIQAPDRVNPKSVLYHYTTLDSYQAMLASRDIWLTNSKSLNDKEEVTYAINLFCDGILQGLIKCSYKQELVSFIWTFLTSRIPKDIFLFSLTNNMSALSQWRAYAAPAGVAIGYPIEVLEDFVKKNNGELKKIIYEPKIQFNALKGLAIKCSEELSLEMISTEPDSAKNILSTILDSNFWNIAVTLKHPSFHEESEWRIIIKEENKQNIKYRTNNARMIPYINYNILDISEDCIIKTPIDIVVVGPMNYQLETIEHISNQLNSIGIDCSCVMGSGIPYQSVN